MSKLTRAAILAAAWRAATAFPGHHRRIARVYTLRLVTATVVGMLGLGMNAEAASLWQVWQAARTHDPAFQAAAAALSKARAAKPGALSVLLPHVNGSLKRSYENANSEGPEYYGQNQILPVSQVSNTGTTSWQIELDQPLFDWSAIKKLQAADLDAAAAAATYQHTLAKLAVKVTTAYLDVLSARATLEATRKAVKGFAEQWREANARYHSGMSGVIGADAARAGLESARGELLAARQQFMAARNTLAALTDGILPGTRASLPTHYSVEVEGNQRQWLSRAMKDNPRLAASRLSAQADWHRVVAADSGYLPNVSLALIHNQQIQSGTSSYSVPGAEVPTPADYNATGNQIAVQLTWNFFDGGATRARVRQAEAQADQSEATAATTRLDVTREVKTRYAALKIDAQRLKTLRSAVTAANDAVKATTLGVPAGVRTEDDLVTQRERLLSAEQSLNAAIATAVTDKLSLFQVEGTLTGARLHALSNALAQRPADSTQPETTAVQSTGENE